MKNIFLILLFTLPFEMPAIAGTGGTGDNIENVISKNMRVPEELKKSPLDEKVTLQFTISNDGQATLLSIDTSNQELKKYISEKFTCINFSTVEKEPGKIYFIDLKFKVL